MAFLKYADAIVNLPRLENHKHWNSIRSASSKTVQTVEVAKILPDFNPTKYLLTHATIVASVDVEPNIIGVSGVEYLIKPECSQYVNQNGDSWERRLLMSTYNTFIGAYNFLEHVQIPYLSKGRIIDAVAREIDNKESIYIDILVATERKHRDLVASIESGDLNTLSMGCSIQYSICSKCGKKASDEAELCHHIRWLKNQYFIDDQGNKRIIAELCGHHADPESNVFIEASWVANPAFKGAVLRNILLAKGQEVQDIGPKIEAAYVRKANEGTLDGYLKAASTTQIVDLEKKILAIKQANTLLTEAGLSKLGAHGPSDEGGTHDASQEGSDPYLKDEDKPENPSASSPSDENQEDSKSLPDPFDQPTEDAMPAATPEEHAPMPDKSQSRGEAAPEGTQATPPGSEGEGVDYGKMFDEALATDPARDQVEDQQPPTEQGGALDQPPAQPGAEAQPPTDAGTGTGAPPPAPGGGMPPGAGAPPAAPKEPETMKDIINRVKKDIRQQVIDELSEELSEDNDPTAAPPESISRNDTLNDLTAAFIDIYKPRTGYSSAKLASIFNLLWSVENHGDVLKCAQTQNDLIDLFQFIDRFQVKSTVLKEGHYNLLRKAGADDLKSLNTFLSFLHRNQVTDKAVIKSLVTKANFIREYHKGPITD